MPKSSSSSPEDSGSSGPLAPGAAGPTLSEQALQESLAELAAVYAAMPVAILIVDPDLRVRRVNAVAARLAGRTEPEMVGLLPGESLRCLHHLDDPAGCGAGPDCSRCPLRLAVLHAVASNAPHEQVEACLSLVGEQGPRKVWLSLSTVPVALGGQRHVLVCAQDITARKRSEEILRARMHLSEYALGHSLEEVLTRALDEAEHLTDSRIGFFHFVEADQKTLSLQQWSTNTLRNMCTAEGKGVHYPADQGGVWLDALRQRRAVIHNDYAALPHRKGLPPGHAPLYRELVIPILRNDLVVGLLGVGNKPGDYTAGDIDTVGSLADLAWDVVLAKRAEEAHRQSEQRYKSLVNNIGLGVALIESDFRICSVNEAMAGLFDKTAQDFVGKECFREFEKRETICPDCPGRAAMKTGRPAERERQGIRDDGRTILARVQAFPVFDPSGRAAGFIEVVEDITERRRAQEQHSTVLKTAIDGFWLIDSRGRILEVNDAFCQMNGYSREELLRMSVTELEAVETPEETAEHIRQVMAAGKARFESQHRCKDGRLIDIELSATYLGDPWAQFFCFIRDITDRKRVEEKLRQAQKMEAIGQLAGGVAHDFRNQLTVIKGYAEMLLRRSLVNEEGRGMLQEILRAAERSATTTGQLLAYSRQETLCPSVQSLTDCVADIGKILPHMIGEDVRLTLLSSADDCQANVDPHLFQQAILNLTVNARDAMPKGGTLSIETACTSLGAESRKIDPELAEGSYVVVTVADTGSGMDKPTLARAFDPFFTTKGVGKGTGLGLPMVYGFVKQSGGAIDIQSEPGHGTAVRLYFPLATPAASADASAPPDSDPPRGRGETVLLVEDEPAVRAVTATLLRDAGYRVLEAPDAEAALTLARQPDRAIDVLVTDVVMPGMTGVALAEQLRTRDANLAVVFMSGYPGVALSTRGLDQSKDILTKPFTSELLLGRIRRVLDSRKPEPGR